MITDHFYSCREICNYLFKNIPLKELLLFGLLVMMFELRTKPTHAHTSLAVTLSSPLSPPLSLSLSLFFHISLSLSLSLSLAKREREREREKGFFELSIFALSCSEGFLNVLNSSYRVSSLKKTDQNIKLQHNKKLQKGTFLKQPILLAYSKAIHFIE